MYNIQLISTRKCNQDCYYCTTNLKEDEVEIDLDFVKYVLDCCPSETSVELTGGEIGLIDNLDDFYKIVKDNKHIKHIIVLSNGLIRKIGVDWLNEVEYWEHLIKEINGREIEKFYDLDLNQSHRYVIVTTKKTTSSLIANWSHFERIGLFKENFFYKLMNHKSTITINSYIDNLATLYSRLNDVYFQRMLIYFFSINKFNHNIYEEKKKLCQKYPPNIYVNLQTRELGHCAINVNESKKIEFNKKNLEYMMNGVYNNNIKYCKKCYSFDNGKNRSMLNNRSYMQ